MYAKKKFLKAPLAALTLMIVASGAQAELCANKLGQVFSRAQCKAKETVVPGTPGPIGPIGPQGQTGPQGPSGIDKSPCKLSSISGYFHSYTNDDYSNSLESCILYINSDGAVSNLSGCTGARNGVNVPIVNIRTGQASMLGTADHCLYRITYTKENGQSFMMTGSLNGTRENYNGFGEDFNGVMKGTMVSTRFYPVAASSTSAKPSIIEGDDLNNSLREIAELYLQSHILK